MPLRSIASTTARLSLAVLVLTVLAGCDKKSGEIALTGLTMGTAYTVKIAGQHGALDQTALGSAIEATLDEIVAAMSTYDETSELSRLNRNATTDWVSVSPALHEVLSMALAVSELSGGAFDVTVGPLVNLWGFGPQEVPTRVPSAKEIARERLRVGYRHLALRDDPMALRKSREDLYIDLSGIAKGYAVDRVAALLDARGLADYMVEIGGEVRVRGFNRKGVPWRIAVEQPLVGRRIFERVIGLTDSGMASSGDYRNYFELDGRRYAHTIDPTTGAPVTHALAAVTVLDASTMRADALATALLVLGPERGFDLAIRESLAVLFLIRTSDGFDARETPAFGRAVVRDDRD